jgi:hypothetical protein
MWLLILKIYLIFSVICFFILNLIVYFDRRKTGSCSRGETPLQEHAFLTFVSFFPLLNVFAFCCIVYQDALKEPLDKLAAYLNKKLGGPLYNPQAGGYTPRTEVSIVKTQVPEEVEEEPCEEVVATNPIKSRTEILDI